MAQGEHFANQHNVTVGDGVFTTEQFGEQATNTTG
jgi:hypothetical protein